MSKITRKQVYFVKVMTPGGTFFPTSTPILATVWTRLHHGGHRNLEFVKDFLGKGKSASVSYLFADRSQYDEVQAKGKVRDDWEANPEATKKLFPDAKDRRKFVVIGDVWVNTADEPVWRPAIKFSAPAGFDRIAFQREMNEEYPDMRLDVLLDTKGDYWLLPHARIDADNPRLVSAFTMTALRFG